MGLKLRPNPLNMPDSTGFDAQNNISDFGVSLKNYQKPRFCFSYSLPFPSFGIYMKILIAPKGDFGQNGSISHSKWWCENHIMDHILLPKRLKHA